MESFLKRKIDSQCRGGRNACFLVLTELHKMVGGELVGLISIAIDGPAGAGKSTVARELARQLGLWYVDTGAMYRAVAWLVVRYKVSPGDERSLVNLLNSHPLSFTQVDSDGMRVYAEGTEITSELRSLEVSEVVSKISVHSQVRERLTQWQRDFSRKFSVVMDGRDIGTVVLPDANVKIYLTADLSERAKRRVEEYSRKGLEMSLTELKDSIIQRDERDSSREVAPLKPAPDAYCIDSTGKTVAQVVAEILAIVERVEYD